LVLPIIAYTLFTTKLGQNSFFLKVRGREGEGGFGRVKGGDGVREEK
jgi:hypothetical protein